MTFCLASVTTKPAGLRSASFLMTCPTIPLKPPSSVGRPHAPSGGVSAGKERQEIDILLDKPFPLDNSWSIHLSLIHI